MEMHPALVISQVLFALATTFVAERRGGLPLLWLILGLLFGPIAFGIALTAGKKCKRCGSWIPGDAEVCRKCGANL